MAKLKTTELKTGKKPDAAIIWLHGLGASGSDFVPIVNQLHLPEHLSIHFMFPDAPVRPITINQGYRMRGWYDITSLGIADEEDEKGIQASSKAVNDLCRSMQKKGIDSSRIILAGFSQGGAVALHCGLGYPEKLAGIMALSSYLPKCCQTGEAANSSTPVFMAHGAVDDVVTPEYGHLSRQRLEKAGYPVAWHEYPIAHSVCLEEIQDISAWIQGCLD